MLRIISHYYYFYFVFIESKINLSNKLIQWKESWLILFTNIGLWIAIESIHLKFWWIVNWFIIFWIAPSPAEFEPTPFHSGYFVYLGLQRIGQLFCIFLKIIFLAFGSAGIFTIQIMTKFLFALLCAIFQPQFEFLFSPCNWRSCCKSHQILYLFCHSKMPLSVNEQQIDFGFSVFVVTYLFFG